MPRRCFSRSIHVASACESERCRGSRLLRHGIVEDFTHDKEPSAFRRELIKRGIRVAKRTVQRAHALGRLRSRPSRAGTPPAQPHPCGLVIFCRLTMFGLGRSSRSSSWTSTPKLVHVGVKRHPTAQRTAHQLREATPFGVGPQLVIPTKRRHITVWLARSS
jgi:hypothetical protein